MRNPEAKPRLATCSSATALLRLSNRRSSCRSRLPATTTHRRALPNPLVDVVPSLRRLHISTPPIHTAPLMLRATILASAADLTARPAHPRQGFHFPIMPPLLAVASRIHPGCRLPDGSLPVDNRCACSRISHRTMPTWLNLGSIRTRAPYTKNNSADLSTRHVSMWLTPSNIG